MPSAKSTLSVQALIDAAAREARGVADACFAVWDNGREAASRRDANMIMDCQYVASTTARLLSHAAEYPLHTIAMQVAVCRRVAARCAALCIRRDAGALLVECGRACRICEDTCRALLGLLWDGEPAALAEEADDKIDDEKIEDEEKIA